MSLIFKSCLDCPFSRKVNKHLKRVHCKIEKCYVKLDMSECKIFEPKDLSQYSQHGLYKENVNINDLEITSELNAKNIANIFIKNRINPRMLTIDFSYSMIEIDLVIDSKDIFLLDKASKDVTKTLGVECMIRPRLAPYHVFDLESHNEENYKKLAEIWSEEQKCKTFFYKSGLNAEQMIKVADLLHAIQNNYCIGAKCHKYKEGEICEFYSDVYCKGGRNE